MSNQERFKETSSPGCTEIFIFSIASLFLVISVFLIVQVINNLKEMAPFPLVCFSFFLLVFTVFSVVITYKTGKYVLIKYTLATDPETGGPIVTGSFFGKTVSTKIGSPPQKIALNLDPPSTHYPPSTVTLHYAISAGIHRRGGIKWYRYPASLIEAPLAVLGALHIIDFYHIVFKEDNIMGKSETTVQIFIRPAQNKKPNRDVLYEQHILDIIYDWDARELPYGMPLSTMVRELFGRYYFKDARYLLRAVMKDAEVQGLGDIKRLGTLWQTSPQYVAALDDDSTKLQRFMEQLRMQYPSLGTALKDKTFQAIPKHDEALTLEQQKQALKTLFGTDSEEKQ